MGKYLMFFDRLKTNVSIKTGRISHKFAVLFQGPKTNNPLSNNSSTLQNILRSPACTFSKTSWVKTIKRVAVIGATTFKSVE